jgi:hypothetical protein
MGAVGRIFEKQKGASMKFIWRYLFRKLRDAGSEPEDGPSVKPARLVASRDVGGDDEGLNITVRTAVGGKIVSFRHYDQRSDRNYWKTYIIPEELDFERELGKMITLESMRG